MLSYFFCGVALVKIYKYLYGLTSNPSFYHCVILLTKHSIVTYSWFLCGGRGSNLFGMISQGFLSWNFFCNSKNITLFSMYILRLSLGEADADYWLRLKIPPSHSCMVLMRDIWAGVKGGCRLGVMDYKCLKWELPFWGDA